VYIERYVQNPRHIEFQVRRGGGAGGGRGRGGCWGLGVFAQSSLDDTQRTNSNCTYLYMFLECCP
jgi:hypothetical protein